ncbi:MAG: hypothetical protein ACLRZG_04390 [Streptococcus sp.]
MIVGSNPSTALIIKFFIIFYLLKIPLAIGIFCFHLLHSLIIDIIKPRLIGEAHLERVIMKNIRFFTIGLLSLVTLAACSPANSAQPAKQLLVLKTDPTSSTKTSSDAKRQALLLQTVIAQMSFQIRF